jgi:hypothetical protein
MENENKTKTETVNQEVVELIQIQIQLLFSDKSIKACNVPQEVLNKVADVLLEYEMNKNKNLK